MVEKYKGTSRSRIEIDRAYAKWVTKITSPQVIDKESKLSLREVFSRYLKKMQGGSYYPAQKRMLQTMLERFGDIPAIELTQQQVEDFQIHLRGVGYAPSTINQHIACGKAAWTFTMRKHENPFKVKMFRMDNKVTEFLSGPEEIALLDAAKTLDQVPNDGNRVVCLHAILLCALRTGLRRTNVLNLNLSEVDLDNRLITIRQKGDKTHHVHISDELLGVLKAITPSAEGFFFVNPFTGKPYRDISNRFGVAKKMAGITRAFRFHDLRHTFATKMQRQTGNLHLVSRALGHTTIMMSQRYAHISSTDMAEAFQMQDQSGL